MKKSILFLIILIVAFIIPSLVLAQEYKQVTGGFAQYFTEEAAECRDGNVVRKETSDILPGGNCNALGEGVTCNVINNEVGCYIRVDSSGGDQDHGPEDVDSQTERWACGEDNKVHRVLKNGEWMHDDLSLDCNNGNRKCVEFHNSDINKGDARCVDTETRECKTGWFGTVPEVHSSTRGHILNCIPATQECRQYNLEDGRQWADCFFRWQSTPEQPTGGDGGPGEEAAQPEGNQGAEEEKVSREGADWYCKVDDKGVLFEKKSFLGIDLLVADNRVNCPEGQVCHQDEGSVRCITEAKAEEKEEEKEEASGGDQGDKDERTERWACGEDNMVHRVYKDGTWEHDDSDLNCNNGGRTCTQFWNPAAGKWDAWCKTNDECQAVEQSCAGENDTQGKWWCVTGCIDDGKNGCYDSEEAANTPGSAPNNLCKVAGGSVPAVNPPPTSREAGPVDTGSGVLPVTGPQGGLPTTPGDTAATPVDCRNNPVAPPSAGTEWVASCNESCKVNSDCDPNISQPNFIVASTSRWCYGFAGGGRCLQLRHIGTQAAVPGAASPAAGNTGIGITSSYYTPPLSGATVCSIGSQSPALTLECLSCIKNERSSLTSDIKNLDSARLSSCSDQELVQYWCNGGVSAGATTDCNQLKSRSACAQKCGVTGGGTPVTPKRTTVSYRFAESANALENAVWQPYTIGGVTVTHPLSDAVPGAIKFIFAQFKDDQGTIINADPYPAQIQIYKEEAEGARNLSVNCLVSKTRVGLNESVTFTGVTNLADSDTGKYVYSWNVDMSHQITNNQPTAEVTKSFSTAGEKQVRLSVAYGSQSATANCSPITVGGTSGGGDTWTFDAQKCAMCKSGVCGSNGSDYGENTGSSQWCSCAKRYASDYQTSGTYTACRGDSDDGSGGIPAGSKCSAYEVTTVCGLSNFKTYDKCTDDKGQTGSSLCSGTATSFYCEGSTNSSCISSSSRTGHYSCSACPNLKGRASSGGSSNEE